MTKVLIVEDERIVARDIQQRLESLGYTVSAVVSSGEKAYEVARTLYPDLVLMDIVLKGKMDGIEAASRIQAEVGIPVIYLTAHADENTLRRAKVTQPYGYILKPFEDRELHIIIEMALYKYTAERKVKESEEWLATTLKSIADGVITADTQGFVTFMNPVAEMLTGWTQEDALGRPLSEVFVITNGNTEDYKDGVDVTRVIREGAVRSLADTVVLKSRDGKNITIHHSTAMIRDDRRTALGTVVVFQDMTEHRRILQQLRDSEEKYKHIGENSIDGVGMAQNFKIIYINDAYCTIFGYKREELMGENLLKVVALEDQLLIEERARKRFRGEKVPNNYIFTGMRKDGTKLLIEVSSSESFMYKGAPTILSILRDVTERERAKTQLKDLFEASRLINSTMDMGKIFTFISESVQKLIGFDNFVLFLCSEDNLKSTPVYASGKFRRLDDLILDTKEGLIGHSVSTGETIIVEDAEKEEVLDIPGMKSAVVVPLITEGECIGALHISKSRVHAYTAEDTTILNVLSEVISSALRNSQLHRKVKEFGLGLEKRMDERSKKIEILLETKQNLEKERNWEKGLVTIIENTSNLGFEQVGVFLVNTLKNTLDFHFGVGDNLPELNMSLSLKDHEYFGVTCVREKKIIHVKDASTAEGKQITRSHSFVWVPIVVRDEAFAAIAAGNVSSRPITEEEVKDLEILAGMCAAFIDRTRVLVEPVAEDVLKTEFKYWLDPSEGYIVLEKKPKKSFEIFVDLVTHGIPGFVISRTHPEKIARKYKLTKTPLVWLSRSGRENAISPDDLSKLRYIIEDFAKKSGESVILLDGLEYLITQTGFEPVLMYMQELKDAIVLSNSRLIIPLHKETLAKREHSALEREFTILV